MEWLDEGIEEILEKFSYEFYVAEPDLNVTCVCMNYTTKQGDPECEKCFGEGYRMRIRKMKGTFEDRSSTFQNQNVRESSVSHIYYIPGRYRIKDKSVIVDGDDAKDVHRLDRRVSANKRLVFYRCLAIPKKNNRENFIKSFKKALADWKVNKGAAKR